MVRARTVLNMMLMSFSAMAVVALAWTVAGFQMTFAIITVALISGAIADRVRFGTWMAFSALWVLVCYAPMAHMVWGGGLLSGDGPFAAIAEPVDFAGGTGDTAAAGGTDDTAAAVGLGGGSRADIVLLDAENPMDALVCAPARQLVLVGGEIAHDECR